MRFLFALLLIIGAQPVFAQAISSAVPSPPVSVPAGTSFSFALPPFDTSVTPTDVSFLNEKPAGSHGFVSTLGEHFVDGKGKRLRLWGVNLNFGGVFPPKTEAPLIARRLAKFGFNAVRLHHFEGNAAPGGIWKPAMVGSSRLAFPREFDADALDRFDFFIAELIKNGIYIDLNLHVARKSTEADGISGASTLPEKDKGVDFFDEHLIALQQQFSKTLLTHVNPYTMRALKDEPGVCAVEVSNEDSLLGLWLDGNWKATPEISDALRTKWNEWLRAKYSEASLRAAWTEFDDTLGQRDLFAEPYPITILNPDAPDSRTAVSMNSLARLKLATVTGARGTLAADETAGPTMDGWVRPGTTVGLDTVGTAAWSFQVNRDGLDLVEGQPYTLSFWARADTPRRISVNLWQDRLPNRFEGFTGYADLSTDWQQFTYTFRPANPDPANSRLSWNLGNAVGAVGLGEISLRTGGRIAAPTEWTLASGVPLIDYKAVPILTARRDYAQFLGSLEADYSRNMRTYLKGMGVKVPLWISQSQFGGWGGFLREADSDATDVHAYWKHPNFGPNGWNNTTWTIGNESMTRSPAIDPLSAFAFLRTPGKPFVMSEWNSGQPNDFGGESLLMAASYAAWQDWAGIFLFDYHSNGVYDRNKIEGFFSIDSHPTKMVSAPAAALMFRRGDLDESQNDITLTLPSETIWSEAVGLPDGTSAAPFIKTWRDAGAWRGSPLEGRVYARVGNAVFPTATTNKTSDLHHFISDTRQIDWDGTAGTYCVSTPRSKLMAGFWGGHIIDADELKIAMPPSPSNFAVFSLSSLDGADIPVSKNMLLTVTGKAENIGMAWNADRTTIGNGWGTGPSQVEGITATIRLVTNQKAARVWALDEGGQQRSSIPATWANSILEWRISAADRTLWYQIDAP